MTPALEPGTRVEFTIGKRVYAVGTVMRHARRLGAYRRIVVRWDATPSAPERISVVSSLRLREVDK